MLKSHYLRLAVIRGVALLIKVCSYPLSGDYGRVCSYPQWLCEGLLLPTLWWLCKTDLCSFQWPSWLKWNDNEMQKCKLVYTHTYTLAPLQPHTHAHIHTQVTKISIIYSYFFRLLCDNINVLIMVYNINTINIYCKYMKILYALHLYLRHLRQTCLWTQNCSLKTYITAWAGNNRCSPS